MHRAPCALCQRFKVRWATLRPPKAQGNLRGCDTIRTTQARNDHDNFATVIECDDEINRAKKTGQSPAKEIFAEIWQKKKRVAASGNAVSSPRPEIFTAGKIGAIN